MNRARRIILLLVVLAIAVAGAVGFYLWRHQRRDGRALAALAEGQAAAQEGRLSAAISGYRRYLRRFADDPEARHAIARFIHEHPDSGEHERIFAVQILKQGLTKPTLPPDAVNVLMQLHLELGLYQEALAIARDALGDTLANDDLVPDDPEDRKALWVQALAFVSLGQSEDAVQLIDRVLASGSAGDRWYFLALDLKVAHRRPEEDILHWAESSVGDRPVAPFLMAETCRLAGQSTEARRHLRRLPTRSLDSPELTFRLVRCCDALGDGVKALGVLRDAWLSFKTAEFRLALVGRLWRRGEYEEAVVRTNDLQEWSDPRAATVLGYRVLSLNELGRLEEAGVALGQFANIKWHALAPVWGRLLRTLLAPDGPDAARELIDAARAGVMLSPQTPIFSFYLGNGYEAVGEMDLAIRFWVDAAQACSDWGAPALIAARHLLHFGRVDDAENLFELAQRRWGGDPRLKSVRQMLMGSRLTTMGPEERLDFEAELRAAGSVLTTEALPFFVTGLAEEGRTVDADELVATILLSDRSLDPETLVRLAWLTQEYGLGTHGACVDALSREHAGSAEYEAYRAVQLASSGDVEGGLRILVAGRNAAVPEDVRAWEILRADYLQRADRKEAGAAWIALAREYPDDAEVLRAAAASGLIWGDGELAAETVERLKAMTGESGLQWRVANVHQLLAGQPTREDVAEAVRILREVLNLVPYRADLRLLLTSALQHLGELNEAISQAQTLLESGHSTPSLSLQLARTYAGVHQYFRARGSLREVLEDGRATPAQVAETADLAMRIGEFDLADEATALLPSGPTKEGRYWSFFQARMHMRLNQPDQARQHFAVLLEQPDLGALLLAMEFFSTRGEPAEVNRLIALLDSLELPAAGKWLVRAESHRATGAHREAEAAYRQSMAAQGDSPGAATRLLSLLAAAGRPKDLMQTLRAMEKDRRWIAELEHLVGRELLIEAACRDGRLRRLLTAWIENPAITTAAEELIRTVGEYGSGALGVEEFVQGVASVADQNERRAEVQGVSIALLMGLGEYMHSLKLARRAAGRFPIRDIFRRQLVECLLGFGRIDEAYRAALRWKRKTIYLRDEVDLILARTSLLLGDAESARVHVERQALAILAGKPGSAEVLTLYLRSLMRLGLVNKARDILDPLCSESPAWRNRAAQMISADIKTAAPAEKWLRELDSLASSENQDELLGQARGWAHFHNQVAAWEGDDLKPLIDRARSRAEEIFKEITDLETADGRTWMLVGTYQESMGMTLAAELSYRKAIELDSELLVARNNLAFLLPKRGLLKEGLALARALVAAAPDVSEFQDTLARACELAHEYDQALVHQRRAHDLKPFDSAFRMELARVLMLADRKGEAARCFDSLKLEVDSGRILPLELWKTYISLRKQLD